MTPLYKSIKEYVEEDKRKASPLHVCLTEEEVVKFRELMDQYRYSSFSNRLALLFKSYRQTLLEQGLDIREKLLDSAYSYSDRAIRSEIAAFNLFLRYHLRDFPIHYNTPHRTKGQRGPLRKPMHIAPIANIDWTDVKV